MLLRRLYSGCMIQHNLSFVIKRELVEVFKHPFSLERMTHFRMPLEPVYLLIQMSNRLIIADR